MWTSSETEIRSKNSVKKSDTRRDSLNPPQSVLTSAPFDQVVLRSTYCLHLTLVTHETLIQLLYLRWRLETESLNILVVTMFMNTEMNAHFKMMVIGLVAVVFAATAVSSTSSSPSLDPCVLITEFAKQTASFSTCAITSGTRMYKRCVNEILQPTNTYEKLMPDEKDNLIHESTCFADISTDDARQRFASFYNQACNLWLMNNCDNCFIE